MNRILITGGAGFIGSALVHYLVAQGKSRILNIDKLTYAGHLASLQGALGSPSHEFVQGDIADRHLMQRLLFSFQPQTVLNLAAETHVDRSLDAPDEFVRTNVWGTCNLLEEVLLYWQSLSEMDKGLFRFLQLSTDEVFGSAGPNDQFDESSRYSPSSPYAASKASADHFVNAYFKSYGLPVVLVHSTNNYGPYQYPEKLIPLMILNALERKELPVYGDGTQIRDWLHVADHCEILSIICERGTVGESYQVGGKSELTNLEVVRAICACVDQILPSSDSSTSDLIAHVTDRPGHDARYSLDSSKVENEFGWHPRIPFETGIRDTVNWYQDNLEWVRQISASFRERHRLGLRLDRRSESQS